MLLTYSTFHTQYTCHNSAYFIVIVSSIYFTQYLRVSVFNFKYSDKSKQIIFTEKYAQRTLLEKALSQELITQIKCFHFNGRIQWQNSQLFLLVLIYVCMLCFLHCLSFCSLILKKGKYFSMYSFSILKVFSHIFGQSRNYIIFGVVFQAFFPPFW